MDKVTLILPANKKNVEIATKVMKKGGLVIYPTETAYAIGCDYTNEKAKEKIYEVKGRPKKKKLITIVANLEMAKRYGEINELAKELIEKYMPGPLTLIVPGKKEKEFTFRISSNSIARTISEKLEKPIVATSANLSGEEAIYEIDEIERKFNGKVDLILDAGELPQREVSTIVKVLKRKVKVIRKGATSLPSKYL